MTSQQAPPVAYTTSSTTLRKLLSPIPFLILIPTVCQGSNGPGLERLLTASRTRREQPGAWQRGWVPVQHRSILNRQRNHHEASRTRYVPRPPGPLPPGTPPPGPPPPGPQQHGPTPGPSPTGPLPVRPLQPGPPQPDPLPGHTSSTPDDGDPENQFQHLLNSAWLSQSSMYAEGTKRNHRSNLKQFMLFCTKFQKPFCPTTSETLMAFARLESANLSYDSLKNIFSSIKFIHLATDQKYPEDNWQVESTLKAIKRELKGTPNQTLPISPQILLKMYAFCDIASPKGLADWSCFLTSFYCMLRKSSAVPTSLSSFNPKTGLSRLKVSFPPNKGICMVLQNYSKTNQFMNKHAIVPMVTNPTQALCPVFHMKQLFIRFNLPTESPAFSYVEKSKIKCVTYSGFTKELRRLLDAAGYKSTSYSGHSFRRGGASYLYSLGADPLIIQASGDWASDCYTRYVCLSLDQRLLAQQKMAFSQQF